MYHLDTLSVLVADRRREREAAAASSRLVTNTLETDSPARRRAAGTLRRLADRIDAPPGVAAHPGIGTGRGH